MATKDPSAASLGPNMVQRLGDKTYKRRRAAAVAIQMMVRNLATEFKESRIVEIIRTLREDLLHTTSANTRKGGLMALSAAAIALAEPPGSLAAYQRQILEAVLPSFADPDAAVRFAACEALYNIAKVSRAMMLPHFTRVFDIMCKLLSDANDLCREGGGLIDRLFKDILTEQDAEINLDEFVELLSVRIFVKNTAVRKFLVGWVMVLESVPGIDFLPHIHKFLFGFLKILDDEDQQNQTMCTEVLSEIFSSYAESSNANVQLLLPIFIKFVRNEAQSSISKRVSFQCISSIVADNTESAIALTSDILEVTLPMISSAVEGSISEHAVSINQSLRRIDFVKFETSSLDNDEVFPEGQSDDHRQLDLARVLSVLSDALNEKSVSCRIAVLRWILYLHDAMPLRMYNNQHILSTMLLRSIVDAQDRVATLALECLAEISSCHTGHSMQTCLSVDFFNGFTTSLLDLFAERRKFVGSRGSFIITTLAQLMGPERICRVFSNALQQLENFNFAVFAAYEVGKIILETPSFSVVRSKIASMASEDDMDLFVRMYKGWSHSAIITVALCLQAGAYEHATHVLDRIGQLEVTQQMYAETEVLIHILNGGQFSKLQLELLDSRTNAYLIKGMYGLLMLLPQSKDFFDLREKLTTVSGIAMTVNHCQVPRNEKLPAYSFRGVDFSDLLRHFDLVQGKHADHNRTAKLSETGTSEYSRGGYGSRSEGQLRRLGSTTDGEYVILSKIN